MIAKTIAYIPPVVDVRKADPEAANFFQQFFDAKSRQDLNSTMDFFSPDMLTYTDAVLGWTVDSHDALRDVFSRYMPNWGNGATYATRIIGGPQSAIIAFVDTPELFGGEIRALGGVDIEDGKIIRWVDYWDASEFPPSIYDSVKAVHFPTSLKGDNLKSTAPELLTRLVNQFHSAVSENDMKKLGDCLSYDLVYEDLAVRTQVLGKTNTLRYLTRAAPVLPFGKGTNIIRTLGGDAGGGFEWRNDNSGIRGITAIEIDENALISRVTSVYDTKLIEPLLRDRLILSAFDRQT